MTRSRVIDRHRGYSAYIPMRKEPTNCCHLRLSSCLGRLLHMLKTQTQEETQREVIKYLNAAHETAAQKQAEDAAKRRCEHTHRVVNVVAGVEIAYFAQN